MYSLVDGLLIRSSALPQVVPHPLHNIGNTACDVLIAKAVKNKIVVEIETNAFVRKNILK